MSDKLFPVRNGFYLGAYQSAISEASQLTGLTEAEKVERDVFVYRSYIELGTYEVRVAAGVARQVGKGGRSALPATRAPPRPGAVAANPPALRPSHTPPVPAAPSPAAAGAV